MIDINYMMAAREFWILIIGVIAVVVGGIVVRSVTALGWFVVIGGLVAVLWCMWRLLGYVQRVGVF